MKNIVLDSSALIALLFEEKGASVVEPYLASAKISVVNLAEVVSYLIEKNMAIRQIKGLFADLAIDIIPYDEEQAFLTGELRAKCRAQGLSLGDRACLALAKCKKLPVLTADKIWAKLDVGVKIELIR